MRTLLAVVACVAWASSAAAALSSVAELVREAKAHEDAHEDALAARRYTEALALDATCEDAYLGLGALRLRMGDAREAARVYSVALEHAPGLGSALAGRARARRVLGERQEAEDDLEGYVASQGDVGALRELAGWYAEDGRRSAQLSAWRKLLAVGARTGDRALVAEARGMVRALQILVGPADPVVSPPPAADPVRRAMAAIARRSG